MAPDKPQQFSFARHPDGPAPLRRAGSIRRTTTIDSEWLGEVEGVDSVLTGAARDLFTPHFGEAQVLDEASFRIHATARRQIEAVETAPSHPRSHEMIGVRAGGASRLALDACMGETVGDPLYQLLDDFAGASLVAGWIWLHWAEDPHEYQRSITVAAPMGKGPTTGICTGFAPGSSGLTPEGAINVIDQSTAVVGPLVNPLDPLGWHRLPEQSGRVMRRARRIDLWRQDGVIKVDAGFQDSGMGRNGTRTAIHEYRVHAEVDPADGTLLALHAIPHVLPLRECPGAVVKATRMVGRNVEEFRAEVIDRLASTSGCTHLNDVLRSLSDVPYLARQLP